MMSPSIRKQVTEHIFLTIFNRNPVFHDQEDHVHEILKHLIIYIINPDEYLI